MNSTAALAAVAPAALPKNFACPNGEGSAATGTDSFSATLDQAVAAKPDGAGKKAPTSHSAEAANEDTDCLDPRENRLKDQTDDETATESNLAGALAVTAPPPPPQDDPVTPVSAEPAGEVHLVADAGADLWSAPAREAQSGRMTSGSSMANATLPSAVKSTTTLIELLTPVAPTELPARASLPESPQATPAEPVTVADCDLPVTTALDAARDSNASLTPTPNQTTGDAVETLVTLLPNVELTPGKVRPQREDPAIQNLRATRGIWTDPVEAPRGISTAKMVVEMKNTQKTDEIAGMTQQILPSVQSAQVPLLPGLSAAGFRREKTVSLSTDSSALASEKISFSPVRTDAAAGPEVSASSAPSALGRIGELVTREVRLFKRAADDLVEVVLTPDAKTQISLRLQWRDGQVEVQARCDTGDYRTLNGNWPQLQASLAGQGVRLSHLSERVQAGLTDFFNPSSFAQSQGGERRQPEAAPRTEARVSHEPTRPVAPATRSTVRSNRLLESWA